MNMPRTNDISVLQSRINDHKQQIAILEKRISDIQKENQNKAVMELASLIEKRHMTVNDVKRLINQSSKNTSSIASTKNTSQSTETRPNA